MLLFPIAEIFGIPLILCPSPGPSPTAGLLTFPQGKICPSLSFCICEMGIIALTPQSCQVCWMGFSRHKDCFVSGELCDSRRTLSVPIEQGHPAWGVPLAGLGVTQDFLSKPQSLIILFPILFSPPPLYCLPSKDSQNGLFLKKC